MWGKNLTKSRIHIFHVGPMRNKGTQALLYADIAVINEALSGDTSISVSTFDPEGVRRVNETLKGIDSVLPTMLDIPFVKADMLAKRFGIMRGNPKYKVLALFGLVLMGLQTVLSVASAVLLKLGLRPLYRPQLFRSMKSADVLISTSDESFKESASLLPPNLYWRITWWSLLFERTFEILVAKYFRRHVIVFPNSVGPFKTSLGRQMARIALNHCDQVLIRDSISLEIVKSLGIRTPYVLTNDTALLFEHRKPLFEPLWKPSVGVCPGVYSNALPKEKILEYVTEHALALDAVVDKHGLDIVFIPHDISGFEYDDLGISKLILDKMENQSRAQIIVSHDANEFKAYLSRMKIVVTSKMHPAIFAATAYVPCVSVAYDHKQIAFHDTVNMKEYLMNIQDISSLSLFSRIDLLLRNIDKASASLKETIPVLKEDIRKTIIRSLATNGLAEKIPPEKIEVTVRSE
jgi:polysaccharide pyruvyl transferase WcaK-like protein